MFGDQNLPSPRYIFPAAPALPAFSEPSALPALLGFGASYLGSQHTSVQLPQRCLPLRAQVRPP